MKFELLLLVLGSVGFASAFFRNIGTCSVNVEPKTDFNLDEFCGENDGVWSFKLVPHIEKYNNVDWMFLSNNPVADSGVYQTSVYYETVGEEPDVLNQLILFDIGSGLVEAKPVYSNETIDMKFFFLDYQPGSFAYFYVCSDQGVDTNIDHRFVVSHQKLTPDQKASIKDMESDFGFKGTLRYLTEGTTNTGRGRGH